MAFDVEPAGNVAAGEAFFFRQRPMRVVSRRIGDPHPDTDGSQRRGDNLYTNCMLALEAKTGKLRWYYQFTPHDLWDWDAEKPPVLVDATFLGSPRKLLLQANRNGFFYVLDRTNGALLLAKPFVQKLTWASGIGPDGRPQLVPDNVPTRAGVLTCPAIRGATNWMSTAFNPATRLFCVMAVENCFLYRSTMFDGGRGATAPRPADAPPQQAAPAPAVPAAFETQETWKSSPMTYVVNGRQYVAIASGANVLSFALPRIDEARTASGQRDPTRLEKKWVE